MMQKGKVVSEEFNRQIGEQIPGNAVIGARALSMLQGKYVSTAQLFQTMQKGQIQSSTFVPAYAKALEEEFGDLYPLLDKRPDVALTRLTNSFTLFQKSVGQSGFMAALGNEFTRLRNLLVEGEGASAHLRPEVEKLAETLGHNLAQMVHFAGDAFAYLLQHMPEIISAVKALAALKVGATFIDWGKGAAQFAGSLMVVKKGAEDVTKAEATAAVVKAAQGTASLAGKSASEIVSAARAGEIKMVTKRPSVRQWFGNAFAGVVGAMGADKLGPQGTPYTTTAEELRKRHPLLTEAGAADLASESRTNWTNAMRGKARVGANLFEGAAGASSAKAMIGDLGKMKPALDGAKMAATTFATGGLNLVFGAFGKAAKGGVDFMGILKGIGPLLMGGVVGVLLAAGVALAAFGDHMTTVGGKQVQFNDIVGGGFKVLGDHVKDWWDKSGKNIGAFGVSLGDLGKNSGEIVATIVAGFVTLGDVIARVFSGIAKLAMDLITNSPLIKLVEIMMHVASGDMKGAGTIAKDYIKSGAGLLTMAGDVANTAGGVAGAIGNFGKTRQDVINAASASADARNSKQAGDAMASEQNAQLEQQLQARQQALKDLQSAGELEALQNRAKLGDITGPTWDSVFQKFASAGQATAQAATVAAGAAATTADAANVAANGVTSAAKGGPAQQNVMDAIQRASRITGVDENVLQAIAYRESKFNPTAANPDTSARGLFQFTQATAKQYGLTTAATPEAYKKDPGMAFDAQASSLAAARMAKDNAKAIEKYTGESATGGQLYAAHFMGAGGVVDLLKSVKKDPNASFATAFPDAAKKNDFTKGMSVSQVYKNLTDTVGNGKGSAAAISPGQQLAGITEVEGDTIQQKWVNLNKQILSVTAEADPAARALSSVGETLDKLDKYAEANKKLVQTGASDQFTPEVKAGLERVRARIMRDVMDAANPFTKDTRLATEQQQVMDLRLKGLSEQADFQDKLNQLEEQGYDITKLNTQANRDAAKAISDTTDRQQAQLRVTEALNAARQAQIARTGTALDNGIAQGVAAQSKQGESYDQTLARVRGNGSLNDITRAAQVNEGSRQAGVQQGFGDQLSEMRATQRLNPTEKSFRDDYKQYLKEVTGVQSDSLDTIAQHATAAQKAMAESYAKTKQTLENPPGFQKWADSLEPFAKKLEDIKSNFAEGLSDSIVDSIMDPQNAGASFENLMKNTQRQLLKSTVDNMLGGVIETFTGKKKAPTSPQEIAQSNAQVAQVQAQSTQTFSQAVDTFAGAVQQAASAVQQSGSGGGLPSAATSDILGSSYPSIAAQPPMLSGPLSTAIPGLSDLANMGSGLSTSNILGPQLDIPAMAPMLSGPLSTEIPGLSSLANMIPTGSGGGLMGGIGSLLGSAGGGLSSLLGSAGGGLSGLMGGIGGGLSGLMGGIGGMLGGGAGGAAGGGGGIGGMLKGIGGMGALGMVGSLLGALFAPKPKAAPVYGPVNGVIGESRAVNVTGTSIAAHANPIGSLLSSAVSIIGGGMGGGGGLGGMMGGMGGGGAGALSELAGLFKEGGYSTESVGSTVMSKHAWRDAPHYREGTPNTTGGGIPAVLHPNEAVIPLSRGRKIPIEMNGEGGGQQVHMTTNFTVVAPSPDAFRKAQGSITNKQNRDMKRAAARNLTP
jgi:hypothetical protein